MNSSTDTHQPAPPAEDEPAENKTVARLRNYSTKNMIYSMLAVLALAFAWWTLMPNPDEPLERRPVEVGFVADYAAQQSDFAVWSPEAALEQDWTANFASFETYAGSLSWRVGMVSPQDQYVEISQTAEATEEWLAALTDKAGEEVGTRTITGPDGPQEWVVYEGDERALVLEPGPGQTGTTVVRATADWPEIEQFIALLQVAG